MEWATSRDFSLNTTIISFSVYFLQLGIWFIPTTHSGTRDLIIVWAHASQDPLLDGFRLRFFTSLYLHNSLIWMMNFSGIYSGYLWISIHLKLVSSNPQKVWVFLFPQPLEDIREISLNTHRPHCKILPQWDLAWPPCQVRRFGLWTGLSLRSV